MDGDTWDKVSEFLANSFESNIKEIKISDYIAFCLKNAKIRGEIEKYLKKYAVKCKLIGKDHELSIKKRNDGNKKFKEKNYEESLSLYTQSIFTAKGNDLSLPLAYSHRSLVLQIMNYTLESIQNINLALEAGFPRNKVQEMILKNVRCLIQLGHFEKAQIYLENVLKESFARDFIPIIQEELNVIKSKKSEGKEEECIRMSVCSSFELPDLAGGENGNFTSASAYLSVFYNREKGRHVVATHDIKVGDVLFVEKPFAFIIFQDVCHSCCKKTVAPIPCDHCLDVLYCSTECKNDFWKSVHSFECGFGEFFKSIGIAHLSLRILLAASSTFHELKTQLNNLVNPELEDGNVSYKSGDYNSVYNLVTNAGKFDATDLFQYVMTALLLTCYMKSYTTYFSAPPSYEDLKILVFVLWKHIMQLICNGHAITTMHLEESKNVTVFEKSETRTGTAIFPSVSMMNHSCEPSIINSFYGNILVVRASKPIKKGEEVLNCYGPHSRRMKRSKRQEILSKQYFFKCECQACLQPFDIQDKFVALKCESCLGPLVPKQEEDLNRICLDCGRATNILEFVQKENLMYSLLKEGEYLINTDANLALKKLLKSWRLGRKIFYKYHKDLSYAADEIARCLAILEEFKKCAMFLKCCILSVEERFGSCSIELANELKKLGDVMTNYCMKTKENNARAIAQEALGYYNKSQAIIILLCGLQNPDVEEIERNIGILLTITNS